MQQSFLNFFNVVNLKSFNSIWKEFAQSFVYLVIPQIHSATRLQPAILTIRERYAIVFRCSRIIEVQFVSPYMTQSLAISCVFAYLRQQSSRIILSVLYLLFQCFILCCQKSMPLFNIRWFLLPLKGILKSFCSSMNGPSTRTSTYSNMSFIVSSA